MINKNNCMDCANYRPIFSGEWICNITQKEVPEQDIIKDEDCPNFKYEEYIKC